MSFSLRDYLKGGLLSSIGHTPDYKIIMDSVVWFDKGILEESDLAEIQTAIENQRIEPETPEDVEIEETEPTEE